MSVLDNQPVTFSFGIVRLLLVVAVFAVVFAATKPLGSVGILIGLLISLPISGIVLVARRDHTAAIIWSVVSSALGMFVAAMFCPAVHPPHEPGDEFRYMIFGAIVGWTIGIAIGHVDKLTDANASNSADRVDEL